VARDLIPPPSPAGRPPPDAMADVRATVRLEDAAHLADDAVRGPAEPAPYRGRFGFVWGALVSVALCALGLGAVLAVTSNDGSVKLAEHWSSWKPGTSRMLPGAEDIAAHVGREYKQDSGDQLAAVTSGDLLRLGGLPLRVAVRPKDGDLEVLDGPGVVYVLNDLGTDAKAVTGRAGRRNEHLMMREGVELALYSFRYLDDITMVGIMLPQRSGSAEASTDGQQLRTLFFRPGDLLDKLQVPLDRTLSPQPPRPKTITQEETAKIDSLTVRNLFLAKVQPLDSQYSYLVLAPPEVIG
jgi:hypothetical protein